MEVVCNVTYDAQSIKRIAQAVGGTLVWGGGVNLAPVDDAIIKVEYPLSLDPHGQVLASVMAKKKSIGTEYCVIDIPIGEGTKVLTIENARSLARDFIILGEKLGIRTRCAITYGGQPVGRAIGPALEIKEALSVLEGAEKPNSIIEKSLSIAGILLELGGAAAPNKGVELAKKTLKSGKALEKFREIIGAQGGNPDIKSDDIILVAGIMLVIAILAIGSKMGDKWPGGLAHTPPTGLHRPSECPSRASETSAKWLEFAVGHAGHGPAGRPHRGRRRITGHVR
jgi:AMP phosphorylase